nr:PREDICTED: G0/G1 switch protein 2 [Haliaeetus albicilla]
MSLSSLVELTSAAEKKKMETMHELIPFAKEMLSQKPNRKMVKLYMLGSVLAFFGVVIGLVEAVCSPFTSEGRLEEEEEAGGDAEGPGDQAARLLRALRRRGACRGTEHKRLCCPVVPGGGSSKKREGLAEGGDRKCKT